MVQRHGPSSELEAFHNHCLRGIVGITSAQQRIEHISSVQVASKFWMEESLEDLDSGEKIKMAWSCG